MLTTAQRCVANSIHVWLHIHVFSCPKAVLLCSTVICFLDKVYRRFFSLGMLRKEKPLSSETISGKTHPPLSTASAPACERRQQAGAECCTTAWRGTGTAPDPRWMAPEVLPQGSWRQYLLEELQLDGVLQELPHHRRAVRHERFLTESDGLTLENQSIKHSISLHWAPLNPLPALTSFLPKQTGEEHRPYLVLSKLHFICSCQPQDGKTGRKIADHKKTQNVFTHILLKLKNSWSFQHSKS